tara:strand:- start:936 stop:1604 length:669 start_codon:yes stop_codon:yes gene_type:complete
MIFNKIIIRISVAGALLLTASATVSVSYAAGITENRLAAELLVMKGDLRRLDEYITAPIVKKGVKDRLLGASSSLSLLIREALDNNGSLPIPPKHSITSLQLAILNENAKEAKFWVNKLISLYPFKTRGILPPIKTRETLITARALHSEFCSSCHSNETDVPHEMGIERPAWNLFQMAQEIEQEEFAARLTIGVKGDSLTAMENPLSYTEISNLIGYYQNKQ